MDTELPSTSATSEVSAMEVVDSAERELTVEQMDDARRVITQHRIQCEQQKAKSIITPVGGQKATFDAAKADENVDDIDLRREAMLQFLDAPVISRVADLCVGVFDPTTSMTRLVSKTGKLHTSIGSLLQPDHLYPEEAVYLTECANLRVTHAGRTLSIQDIYRYFLSSKLIRMTHVIVYNHFRRSGYEIRRWEGDDQCAASTSEQCDPPQTKISKPDANSVNSNTDDSPIDNNLNTISYTVSPLADMTAEKFHLEVIDSSQTPSHISPALLQRIKRRYARSAFSRSIKCALVGDSSNVVIVNVQ